MSTTFQWFRDTALEIETRSWSCFQEDHPIEYLRSYQKCNACHKHKAVIVFDRHLKNEPWNQNVTRCDTCARTRTVSGLFDPCSNWNMDDDENHSYGLFCGPDDVLFDRQTNRRHMTRYNKYLGHTDDHTIRYVNRRRYRRYACRIATECVSSDMRNLIQRYLDVFALCRKTDFLQHLQEKNEFRNWKQLLKVIRPLFRSPKTFNRRSGCCGCDFCDYQDVLYNNRLERNAEERKKVMARERKRYGVSFANVIRKFNQIRRLSANNKFANPNTVLDKLQKTLDSLDDIQKQMENSEERGDSRCLKSEKKHAFDICKGVKNNPRRRYIQRRRHQKIDSHQSKQHMKQQIITEWNDYECLCDYDDHKDDFLYDG